MFLKITSKSHLHPGCQKRRQPQRPPPPAMAEKQKNQQAVELVVDPWLCPSSRACSSSSWSGSSWLLLATSASHPAPLPSNGIVHPQPGSANGIWGYLLYVCHRIPTYFQRDSLILRVSLCLRLGIGKIRSPFVRVHHRLCLSSWLTTKGPPSPRPAPSAASWRPAPAPGSASPKSATVGKGAAPSV